jgi:hypothetical protein
MAGPGLRFAEHSLVPAFLRPILLAAASFACLAHVARAQPQEDDATRVVAARTSFSEGVALADGGHWVEAVEHFRHALALHDSSTIAFNLGVALSHEGHPVEASELFRRVLRDEASDAALRSDADAALVVAQAEMAWAQVSYAGPTAGLTLAVDGTPASIALLGTSLPLDPGVHHFLVARDETVIGGGTLAVRAGEHARLELTLLGEQVTPHASPIVLDPARVADDATHEQDRAPDDQTGLFVGLGVGGGLVIVTLIVVLAVVLVPSSDATPYAGSLGIVDVGR